MTEHKQRLVVNPDPLRIVERRTGEPDRPKWRCEYEDERGRCTSRETKVYTDRPNRTPGTYREAIALCPKHRAWRAQ
jgi:hypothetical protein